MFSSKKQKKFFVKLSKRPLRAQKRILSKCPNSIIVDLHRLCKRICKDRRIILNKKHIKKLFKFRKILRTLTATENPESSRKYLSSHMKGGFLGTLISVITALATTIIPALIK